MSMVAGHKIAPSEFWGMTIAEIAVFFEATRPKDRSDFAGSLTRGSVDALTEWMENWDDEPATT